MKVNDWKPNWHRLNSWSKQPNPEATINNTQAADAIALKDPGLNDLWFLPLGGCGEIGMNLNLYGHAGRWLMVDCGVTFNNPLSPDYQPNSPLASAEVLARCIWPIMMMAANWRLKSYIWAQSTQTVTD